MLELVRVEIKYCANCGYFSQASWIANELNESFGKDLAITLTPVSEGRLEVYLEDSLLFDRETSGHYPNFEDITRLKLEVREEIE
jgi:selT/selW/selH-like putative selenoprotein